MRPEKVLESEALRQSPMWAGNDNYQPPPANDDVRLALQRRLMIEKEDGGFRMRISIMRKWLQKFA